MLPYTLWMAPVRALLCNVQVSSSSAAAGLGLQRASAWHSKAWQARHLAFKTASAPSAHLLSGPVSATGAYLLRLSHGSSYHVPWTFSRWLKLLQNEAAMRVSVKRCLGPALIVAQEGLLWPSYTYILELVSGTVPTCCLVSVHAMYWLYCHEMGMRSKWQICLL